MATSPVAIDRILGRFHLVSTPPFNDSRWHTVYDSDGRLTNLIQNQVRLYATDAHAAVQDTLQDPSRYQVLTRHHSSFFVMAAAVHLFSIHDFCKTIRERFKKQAGIPIEELCTTNDEDAVHQRALVILGLGTGDVIDKTLAAVPHACHVLVLDDDPQRVRAVQSLPDWEDQLKIWKTTILDRNPRASIRFVSGSPEELENGFRDFCLHCGVMALECRVFLHLPTTGLLSFYKNIEECWSDSLAYATSGFIDDEVTMLRQMSNNIESCFESQTRGLAITSDKELPANQTAFVVGEKQQKRIGTPVCLVGNGPSLDGQLLQLLRTLQKDMIIVSCGTSAITLLNAGIHPDFQVETENISHYEKKTIDRFRTIKNTTALVAFTCFDSLVKSYEQVIFFRRATSEGFFLNISNNKRLSHAAPLAFNAAFDLFLHIGFETFVLLGHDLGAHDPSQHHAKDSIYFQDSDKIFMHVSNIIKNEYVQNTSVAGNFGGKLTTTPRWNMGRIMFEKTTQTSRFPLVFNVSDGAHINETCPILCEMIENQAKSLLPLAMANPQKKARDIKSLLHACDTLTEDLRSIDISKCEQLVREVHPLMEAHASVLDQAHHRIVTNQDDSVSNQDPYLMDRVYNELLACGRQIIKKYANENQKSSQIWLDRLSYACYRSLFLFIFPFAWRADKSHPHWPEALQIILEEAATHYREGADNVVKAAERLIATIKAHQERGPTTNEREPTSDASSCG